jgi:preprotein translocase subunit SecD
MASRRSVFRPALTIVLGVYILLLALPQDWKTWAPGFIRNPGLHLGLDLAGGTQLDFRISEEEIQRQLDHLNAEYEAKKGSGASIEDLNRIQLQISSTEQQRSNLVEAIRTVIERRINGLGVSEATITPSYVGDEKHLLVECPGIVDVQECIKVVGKTIQLEFKEEFTEPTQDFVKEVNARAANAVRRMQLSGATLQKVGQDLSTTLGVVYRDSQRFFRDEIPKGLEQLWTSPPGTLIQKESTLTVSRQNEQGQIVEDKVPGIFLMALLSPPTETGRVITEAQKAFTLLSKTESGTTYIPHEDMQLSKGVDLRVVGTLSSMQPGELKSVASDDGSAHVLFLRQFKKGQEDVDVSHIVISYKGATPSEQGKVVNRTKEEALAKARDLKARIDKGAKFEDLARSDSDAPSGKTGGKLGVITHGTMGPAFEQVAFTLPVGKVSDPVETNFGYHLIRVDRAPTKSPDTANYDELVIKGANALGRADDLIKRLQSGNVRSREPAITARMLFFSLKPTGWKDTALNGTHFRSASATLDPTTRIPVVQILFDDEGAKIFQELTRRNVGKRIAIFVGGELVSAPTVQTEISGGSAVITGSQNADEAQRLAQDLNTGAIPAPIHLVGQHTVEATLGGQALRTSLQAALLGTLILMVYMIVMYRILGVVADLALTIYAVMFFALMKLPLLFFTKNYVVLTLAGMAGIILSIGMAVDANVLVFERLKEELRKGKLVKTAVEMSFQHAWPAIRDGNVSTIITCVILFAVGTSIVRGFAVTLGIGVILSMFTAITITRWMLRRLAEMPLAERKTLFGVRMAPAPETAPETL